MDHIIVFLHVAIPFEKKKNTDTTEKGSLKLAKPLCLSIVISILAKSELSFSPFTLFTSSYAYHKRIKKLFLQRTALSREHHVPIGLPRVLLAFSAFVLTHRRKKLRSGLRIFLSDSAGILHREHFLSLNKCSNGCHTKEERFNIYKIYHKKVTTATCGLIRNI